MKTKDGKIVFESEEETPAMAMSLTDTSWNRTGSWKYLEPFYQDMTPPCIHSCQVGNDIVTFMRLIDEGRYAEASRRILENNPFPATLGRVCPHPCEEGCNRERLGGPILIQQAERFLGDYAIQHAILPELPKTSNPAVTVIGAGPAGLSAAYFLRMSGHPVTVIESEDKPGGLLWTGIPPFRLPREVLIKELERFGRIGIEFKFQTRVGKDVTLEELTAETPAVLLAIGLGQSHHLGIPGEPHPQVVDGIRLLHDLHNGQQPEVGHRVVIIGGGNTAMDCARSLLRLGRNVRILYRRSRKEIPAFADEIAEAEEEGIQLDFLTAPVQILTENDHVTGIECIRMQLGEPDESGRRRPIPVPDSEFILPVDSVVIAAGETLASNELPAEICGKGHVSTWNYRTTITGLFACGDCTGNGGTVAAAVATGREAGNAIHSFLTGKEYKPIDPLQMRGASSEIADYSQFTTEYFREKHPPQERKREPSQRLADFREIRPAIAEHEVRAEAARCFKCGTCNLCDNCRLFCPDNAIRLKADRTGYQILYEYCKGCMVCVEECPRGAIHLRRVEV